MKQYRWIILGLLGLLALSGAWAGNRNTYPLPEDRGAAGILSALEKLPVYVRVLHTTAHPDDESAGTLTWLSRKFHAQTALFCLTRGEGGQNILGNEKYEALGLVRTGELLEACKFYGTELYFGKVLDFGFSKTAEETLSKWDHEATLEDMVRFIRQWRPTIIISRFQGNAGDGHGHHQAAGILTREAFRASGDPQKFPDQLNHGLPCWQAKKLYISARMWEKSLPGNAAAKATTSNNRAIRVPIGDYSPVLGRSYREIGSEGYSKHRSQGNGATYSSPGSAYDYFELADSVVEIRENESSFFDSLDTSLMAIWDLAGDEKRSVSFLKGDLSAIQRTAEEALKDFRISAPGKSAAAIAKGTGLLRESIKRIDTSTLSKTAKTILAGALGSKLLDFQQAMNAVLGVSLTATTAEATAIPGQKEQITLSFYNQGSEKVTIEHASIILKQGKVAVAQPADAMDGKQLSRGSAAVSKFSLEISTDAEATEPFWYLKKSSDARYSVLPTQNEFAPFGSPEAAAEVRYLYHGKEFSIQATAMAQAGDPLRGSDFVEFQIVPAISIILGPDIEISPIGPAAKALKLQASILNNKKGGTQGTLKLVSPAGWPVEPAQLPFSLSREGETFTTEFSLRIPPEAKPGSYAVEAIIQTEGRDFHRGYETISYIENWTRRLYSAARSEIERFGINIAPDLTVGYIPGAGDDIPSSLKLLGIEVHTLSSEDLAFGDLSRFSAIVTGIRAYNVNQDLQANNRRLLNYVAQGGTLIVQYVRPMGRLAPGSTDAAFDFGPYPMSVSNSDRITVEDSPVRILEPENPIFNWPNDINEDDFKGWVQERGLYFMSSWDSRYQALISGNDPGEKAQNGGMLYALYGKGHYVYTGYSWFRQLPAGIPGAFRIFANMLSLGKASSN
jgi:LmbE family N-acetylglucosaminyl deacetylase